MIELRRQFIKRQAFLKGALKGVGIFSVAYIGFNLNQTPITKRTRLLAIPISLELFLDKNVFNKDYPETKLLKGEVEEMTKQLLEPLIIAAEKNILNNHTDKPLFNWRVRVIKSPLVNAMCAPGGNIIIFTGLIDFCVRAEKDGKIDNAAIGVLSVMAHEVAHAVARHSMETLSFFPFLLILSLFVEMFLLSLGFGLDPVRLMMNVFNELLRLIIRLPHSRSLEREADIIGCELLLKIGAPTSDLPKILATLQSPKVEWLSTHPAGDRRSDEVKQYIQKRGYISLDQTDFLEKVNLEQIHQAFEKHYLDKGLPIIK